MSELDLIESPEAVYVAPPREWKGATLAPYGQGAKIILSMVSRRGDAFGLLAFILIFILTHDRVEVMRDAKDPDAFRVKVLDWVDGEKWTDEDREAAEELALLIFKESEVGKVAPIASAGGSAGNG